MESFGIATFDENPSGKEIFVVVGWNLLLLFLCAFLIGLGVALGIKVAF